MRTFIRLTFILMLLSTIFACSDDALNEDMKEMTGLEQTDVDNQKRTIEMLSHTASISNIEYGDTNYTIHFTNAKKLILPKSNAPLFEINSNGYWTINGMVTPFKAGELAAENLKIEVGPNGHWWINGKDTGCQIQSEKTPVKIIVRSVRDHVIFTFSDGSEISVSKEGTPFFKNPPLPLQDDTLRVLCLGNSYTLDAIAYLHELTRNSSIDLKRVVVYVAIGASTTLEYWQKKYTSGVQVKLSRAAGGLTMKTEGTLKELLQQDWDVITLQQKCADAIHYETFNPYLRNLIDIIRTDCPNKNLAFAWQMVWAYWPGHGGAPYGIERYNAICDAVKEQIRKDGIDIIIPIGTAIENARITDLQTRHDITRDGAHLAFGVGRYIAACTWFQAILAPVFKTSIVGNPTLYELTKNDKESTKFEAVPVTEENREKCQQCAFNACLHNFEVTPLGEISGIETPRVD